MGIVEFFIPLGLSREEFGVLLNSIDYYSYASSVLEYGEHTEECQSIRNKIMRHVEPREKFLKYIGEENKKLSANK